RDGRNEVRRAGPRRVSATSFLSGRLCGLFYCCIFWLLRDASRVAPSPLTIAIALHSLRCVLKIDVIPCESRCNSAA
ncbi:hypothetical protein, partial [Candidatus Symbiopectobacterium sp. NZEC135]|uniref:hypothetical protein n=1 Tax=Candidatus Symbiopectobacterium sp. NZEC135 TaxID=2820471 RepID=UPI0022267139